MTKKEEMLLEHVDLIITQLTELKRELLEVKDDGTDAAKETVTQPVPAAAPTPTLEDVRSILAEKARAGYSAQVRELILARGVHKLSDVPESEYSSLLKQAEAIG